MTLETEALRPGEYPYIDAVDLRQAVVEFDSDVAQAVRLVALMHSAEQALRSCQGEEDSLEETHELVELLIREIA